jgi:hypothetical protein
MQLRRRIKKIRNSKDRPRKARVGTYRSVKNEVVTDEPQRRNARKGERKGIFWWPALLDRRRQPALPQPSDELLGEVLAVLASSRFRNTSLETPGPRDPETPGPRDPGTPRPRDPQMDSFAKSWRTWRLRGSETRASRPRDLETPRPRDPETPRPGTPSGHCFLSTVFAIPRSIRKSERWGESGPASVADRGFRVSVSEQRQIQGQGSADRDSEQQPGAAGTVIKLVIRVPAPLKSIAEPNLRDLRHRATSVGFSVGRQTWPCSGADSRRRHLMPPAAPAAAVVSWR